jgi:hypothetical protein
MIAKIIAVAESNLLSAPPKVINEIIPNRLVALNTNETYLKFPQYILPLRRRRIKVGVDEIDPPSPSSPPTVGRGVSTGDFQSLRDKFSDFIV